jgi:HEPN domain-containing protein
MSDHKQARLMLEMANKDFTALRGMTDPQVFVDEIFGFHAQQTVEKVLKAWIAFLGRKYPPSHNIRTLLDVLAESGVDTAGLEELTEYTPYAVRFRYMGLGLSEEPLERVSTLREVGQVLADVEALLSAVDTGGPDGQVGPSSGSSA